MNYMRYDFLTSYYHCSIKPTHSEIMEMASLVDAFERIVVDDMLSPHVLGVSANKFIPENTFLGEVIGARCYSWDLCGQLKSHFWVFDDFFIDCSETGCILAYVKDTYCSSTGNCEIHLTSVNGCMHVYLVTTRDIPEGEPLYLYRLDIDLSGEKWFKFNRS